MLKNLFIALIYSMVFFAGIHLIILGALAIVRGNLSYLNIFNILGVQGFLPSYLRIAPFDTIASVLVMGIVFIFFYIVKKKSP